MLTTPRSRPSLSLLFRPPLLASFVACSALMGCGDVASTSRSAPEIPTTPPAAEQDVGGWLDAGPSAILRPPTTTPDVDATQDHDAADDDGRGQTEDRDAALPETDTAVATDTPSAQTEPHQDGGNVPTPHTPDAGSGVEVDASAELPGMAQPSDDVALDSPCPAPLVLCGERCVDTASSATDCGGCGTVCNAGANAFAQCEAGACTTVCNAGYHDVDPGVPGCEYACEVTNGEVDHCDGYDNDCDGDIDEDGDLESTFCEVQEGVCAGWRSHCVDGRLQCADEGRVAANGPYDVGEEVHCDGLDNDCDGLVDERCASVDTFLNIDGPAFGTPGPYSRVFGQPDPAGGRVVTVSFSRYGGGPGTVLVHEVPARGGLLDRVVHTIETHAESMTAYPTSQGQEVLVQESNGQVKGYRVGHNATVEPLGVLLPSVVELDQFPAGISSVQDVDGNVWVAVVRRNDRQQSHTLLFDPEGFASDVAFERLQGDLTLIGIATHAGATRLVFQEQTYPDGGVVRLYDVRSPAPGALSPWAASFGLELPTPMYLLSVARTAVSELLVPTLSPAPWLDVSVAVGADPDLGDTMSPLRGRSISNLMLALPHDRWLVAAAGPSLELAGRAVRSALVHRDASRMVWGVVGRSQELWMPIGAFYQGDVSWIAYRELHDQAIGRVQIRQMSPEGTPLCFAQCPRRALIRSDWD